MCVLLFRKVHTLDNGWCHLTLFIELWTPSTQSHYPQWKNNLACFDVRVLECGPPCIRDPSVSSSAWSVNDVFPNLLSLAESCFLWRQQLICCLTNGFGGLRLQCDQIWALFRHLGNIFWRWARFFSSKYCQNDLGDFFPKKSPKIHLHKF
jgi:hypothetical protein